MMVFTSSELGRTRVVVVDALSKSAILKSVLYLVMATIAACALTSCAGSATVVLFNDAKEPIDSVVVRVLDERLEFSKIAVGSSVTGMIRVGSDSDYHVTVHFRSGKVLDRRLGYVTNGMALRDEISITDSGVVLKPKS